VQVNFVLVALQRELLQDYRADLDKRPLFKQGLTRLDELSIGDVVTGLSINSLKPNFDHCETLYTRYDFQLEECVHQQILVIEGMLRNMESQLTGSKDSQIKLAKQMRYQTIRRRLLIGSACGIKIYPEYLSQMAEQRSLCEFQKAYNDINESKYQLTFICYNSMVNFFLMQLSACI